MSAAKQKFTRPGPGDLEKLRQELPDQKEANRQKLENTGQIIDSILEDIKERKLENEINKLLEEITHEKDLLEDLIEASELADDDELQTLQIKINDFIDVVDGLKREYKEFVKRADFALADKVVPETPPRSVKSEARPKSPPKKFGRPARKKEVEPVGEIPTDVGKPAVETGTEKVLRKFPTTEREIDAYLSSIIEQAKKSGADSKSDEALEYIKNDFDGADDEFKARLGKWFNDAMEKFTSEGFGSEEEFKAVVGGFLKNFIKDTTEAKKVSLKDITYKESFGGRFAYLKHKIKKEKEPNDVKDWLKYAIEQNEGFFDWLGTKRIDDLFEKIENITVDMSDQKWRSALYEEFKNLVSPLYNSYLNNEEPEHIMVESELASKESEPAQTEPKLTTGVPEPKDVKKDVFPKRVINRPPGVPLTLAGQTNLVTEPSVEVAEEKVEQKGGQELNPGLLIEMMGSDNLKNIYGMFALGTEASEIKNKLANIYDKIDEFKKQELGNKLKAFGFDSFESFVEKWKTEIHEEALAGLQQIVKYQIDKAIANNPDLRKMEDKGTLKQRMKRALWKALPAVGAGASVAIGLATAGVGTAVTLGAAGAISRMVSRFFRGKGDKVAAEKNRELNAEEIQKLRQEIEVKIKEDMMGNTDREGDLIVASALSVILAEKNRDFGDETEEIKNLRRDYEIKRAMAYEIETSGREVDKEKLTNKNIEATLAYMRRKNAEARVENVVPQIVERKSFWTKGMEMMKQAKDAWQGHNDWKKRAAGYVVEGAAGFTSGLAIGLAGAGLAARSMARGGIGFVSGTGEQYLRDRSREQADTETMQQFLAESQNINEAHRARFLEDIEKIYPRQKTKKERLKASMLGGVKRAGRLVALGALFDTARMGYREVVGHYLEGSQPEAEAVDKLRGTAYVPQEASVYDTDADGVDNALDTTGNRAAQVDVESADAEPVPTDVEKIPTDVEKMMLDKFRSSHYGSLVHKGEGVTHVIQRDLHTNPDHLDAYKHNPGVAKIINAHDGNFDEVSQKELNRAAWLIENDNTKGFGQEVLIKGPDDNVVVIFDEQNQRYEMSTLDGSDVGSRIYSKLDVSVETTPTVIENVGGAETEVAVPQAPDELGGNEIKNFYPTDKGFNVIMPDGATYEGYQWNAVNPRGGEIGNIDSLMNGDAVLVAGPNAGYVGGASETAGLTLDIAGGFETTQKSINVPFAGKLPEGSVIGTDELLKMFGDKQGIDAPLAETAPPHFEGEMDKTAPVWTETVETAVAPEVQAKYMGVFQNVRDNYIDYLDSKVEYIGLDGSAEGATKSANLGALIALDLESSALLDSTNTELVDMFSPDSTVSSDQLSEAVSNNMFEHITPAYANEAQLLLNTSVAGEFETDVIEGGSNILKLSSGGKDYVLFDEQYNFHRGNQGDLVATNIESGRDYRVDIDESRKPPIVSLK